MRSLPLAGHVAIAFIAVAAATTARAADDWSKGVIVSADREPDTRSKDDRAIYACARTMMHEMFPEATRIRKPLGTAECDVSRDATVQSLKPGVKDLPPHP